MSFKSCESTQDDDGFLFDHDDIERYPDGNLCYTVNDPEPTLLEKKKTSKFSMSWAMMTYSRKGKGNTLYQSCLGVYCCPVEGCKYIGRPAYPKCDSGEKRRKGRAPDKPLGSDKCSVHHKPGSRVSCSKRGNKTNSS